MQMMASWPFSQRKSVEHRLRWLACILLLISPGTLCQGDELSSVDPVDIDRLFAKWDQPNSPGLAVGVFVDGRAVHTAGYGMANLDEGIAITPDSVFSTYSLAKSFTSACVAMLLDEGRITLNDDVRKYIPELPEYSKAIRIRHLLRCRTGLQDYVHAMMLSGREIDDLWTKEDVFDMICRQRTTPFDPGSSFNYSNSDFFLLGMVVERVSDQSLRNFAAQRIFAPLGMNSTVFDDDQARPVKRRVLGYGRLEDGRFRRIALNSSTVGAMGLKTTINDLVKWDDNFRENKLGGGKRLQELFSTGSVIGNHKCLCGFGVQTHRGLRRTCQTGGGPGFVTHIVRYPDDGLSIALLSNVTETHQWYDMQQLIGRIAELYLGDRLGSAPRATDWNENPSVVPVALNQLETRVGGLRKPDGSFVRVIPHDGGLAVGQLAGTSPPLPLTAIGENRFRAATAHVPYDLLFDEDPRSRRVRVWYQDGFRLRWQRVELVSPTAGELNAFVGEYYCENLGGIHRFTVTDGELFVQFNFGRKRRLVPATADVFIAELSPNIRFEFARNDKKEVESFGVTFERVHYQFEKRK